MPLEPINVPSITDELTKTQKQIIEHAEKRRQNLLACHPNLTTAIGSNPVAFISILAFLQHHALLSGHNFCEWGSGLGLISALAQLGGMQAYGIECEPAFVAEAEALNRDFSIGTHFVVGSFIPADITSSFRVIGTFGATDWTPPTEPDNAYTKIGQPVASMDLIYAYPWPREIGLYQSLFGSVAKPNALLWLYVEGGEPILRRKI